MTYEELAAKILNTHVLGEYVGGAWNLERVMRWIPSHVSLFVTLLATILTSRGRSMTPLGHSGALVFTEYGGGL